ncbi:MAG: hypothetical protein SWO11_23450 [Thermodesulfobacteriota bacterium]|nr:hypothetical protein [Thermodesulfobacteriota bacterium]
MLPSQAPAHKEVIYFPYWRFRGVLFICELHNIHGEITSEVIDKTLQAAPSDIFAFNLGYKIHLFKIKLFGLTAEAVSFPNHTLEQGCRELEGPLSISLPF